jgi:cyanophycin synthetase
MKIVSSTTLKGINIHAPVPVVRILVDFGWLADTPLKGLGEDFKAKVTRHLPELEAFLSGGDEGIAGVVWRAAIAYQRRGGDILSYGTSAKPREGLRSILFEYHDAKIGQRAGRLALALVRYALPEAMRSEDPAPAGFDFSGGHDPVRWLYQGRPVDINTAYILRAASANGVPWFRVNRQIAQLGQGARQKRIWTATSSHLSHVDFRITEDKVISVRRMQALGLPVPEQVLVRNGSAAAEAAKRIGYPVVVKPKDAHTGKGVSTNLTTKKEVQRAFEEAARYSRSIIVETFIEGDDHRLLVINGAMESAVKRVPAHVIGDGRRTVRELVGQKNKSRRKAGRNAKYDIGVDDLSEWHLARQGLSMDSIPAKWVAAYLRSASNYSQGGDSIDITDTVHPDNRAMAVRAARAFDMDIAGIDFITTDISRSWREVGGAICEIGSRPGFLLHMAPDEGTPRDVAQPVIDMLVPPGTQGRIPIAVVAGMRGRGRTSTSLAHFLTLAGYKVGVATRGGIVIDGRPVGRSGNDPSAVRMVIEDQSVDAAILEGRPRDVVKYGLGVDACSVALVLGAATPDRGGFEEANRALRVIAKAARQAVVVNADDDGALEIVKDIPAKNLCLRNPVRGQDSCFLRSGSSGAHLSNSAHAGRGLATATKSPGETGRGRCDLVSRRTLRDP